EGACGACTPRSQQTNPWSNREQRAQIVGRGTEEVEFHAHAHSPVRFARFADAGEQHGVNALGCRGEAGTPEPGQRVFKDALGARGLLAVWTSLAGGTVHASSVRLRRPRVKPWSAGIVGQRAVTGQRVTGARAPFLTHRAARV